ncbi:hypothetical protein [Parabacteroides sp.]
MEPIKLEFISDEEIEKGLAQIKLSIKGIGDESYISFKRLLNCSNEAFNALSYSTQKQAVALNALIQNIKQNEIAQEALFKQWEKGSISNENYALAQAQLSIQLSKLKCEVIELRHEVEQELLLNKEVTNTLQQKIVLITK